VAGQLVIRSAARGLTDTVIPLSTAELMQRHLVDLRLALPYDAGQILVFDRSRDRHRQVAQVGYSDEIARVMAEEFTLNWPRPVWEPVIEGDDLPPTICSERDVPASFRRSKIYDEHLAPAGYRDGLTLELHHRGRYVGLANFSSYTADFYTTELRRRSLAFASLLGHAINATAQDLEGVPLSAAASTLARDGAVHGIAGRAASTLIAHADFRRAAAALFDSPQTDTAFLWNLGTTWFRVVLRRQTEGAFADHQSVVIVEEEIERPYGLTPTELRVLTRLVLGSSNDEIARAMSIGVRTVHTHISAILAKLGCSRRSQAVASAIRNGLFRPEDAPDASLADLIG
jgi:DNA-binding CsgD family transcriptional regulator